MQNMQPSAEVPVYKLVLLKILAALSDVSGHIEEVHHGQAGWLILIKQRKKQKTESGTESGIVSLTVNEHYIFMTTIPL